jgi:hypothetical protein
MRYMNDYDIDFAVSRFTRAAKPNRLALALVVRNLAEWANTHSDGWAYWLKPARAAKQAMLLIRSTTNGANDVQERYDITDAEMAAAVRPIKAFLTRAKATPDDRERILRAVTSD